MASLTVFLTSPASDFVTGTITGTAIPVGGGVSVTI